MEYNTSTPKAIQYGQQQAGDMSRQKKLRKLIIVSVVAVALLVLITIVTSFRFVSITLNASGNVDLSLAKVYSYNSDDYSKGTILKLGGRYLVPRSASSILVEAGQSQSIYTGQVSGSLDITLQEPSSTTKIGSGRENCPFAIGDKAYIYSCTSPTAVKQYISQSTGIPRQATVATFASLYTPARYKDGILVWLPNASRQGGNKADITGSVTYIKPGATAQTLQLSQDANNDFRNHYVQIITDHTNTANESFVVYDYTSGKSYYYSSFSTTSEPRIVSRQYQLDIDGGQTSSCVLRAKIYSCYNGNPTGDHDHSHDTAEIDGEIGSNAAVPQVESVDLNDKSSVTKVYKSESNLEIDDLLAAQDDSFYARSGNKVYQLSMTGDSLSIASTITSNASLVAAGQELHFVQESKLYSYSAATSTVSLRLPNSTGDIEGLHAWGSQILLTSVSAKDPLQLINTYKL